MGPLPWLLTGLGGDAHIVAPAHAHHDEHAAHDHRDSSDVPGSPAHPADHHCLACQVLAQMGRCCAVAAPPPLVPPSTAPFYAARIADAPVVHVADFALTPPARAPPAKTGPAAV